MGERTRIMLVSHRVKGRNFLRLYLEAEGYAVEEAATGQEGLEQARVRVPRAVIAEARLLDMKGVDFFEALRALPALKAVPVLLVAQVMDERDRHYAEMLGVDSCWVRPLDPEALLAHLKGLLGS